MANTGRPNSGGSQFFINAGNNNFLDYFENTPSNHPVFGKIVKGMRVVDLINETKTGPSDKPVKPIIMNKITIEE
eukprot:Awhi_evm1s1113